MTFAPSPQHHSGDPRQPDSAGGICVDHESVHSSGNTKSFGSALRMTKEKATGCGTSTKKSYEIRGCGPGPRSGFRGGGEFHYHSSRTHIHRADIAAVV